MTDNTISFIEKKDIFWYIVIDCRLPVVLALPSAIDIPSASLAASASRVGGQQLRPLSGINPTSTNTQIPRRVSTRPSHASALRYEFGSGFW